MRCFSARWPGRIGSRRWKALERALVLVVVAAVFAPAAQAQRQMEKLGRGLIVLRSASSQAYLSWRLLATDPEDIAFNVYRSAGGAPAVKINPGAPLSQTTDFLDTTANLSVSNAWQVVPVVGGVEQPPSPPFGLPANPPVRRYLNLPLQRPVNDGLNYDVKFCWVGDFDGDGEYDYLVDRTATTGNPRQYLQAYLRNGTLLWQVDMGPLSTNRSNSYEPDAAAISVGDKDNVTVYDLDGDNRAEVVVRVANGTVLPGNLVVTTNNNISQFLSVLDGLTGAERARALIPNPYFADGPLNCHAGIAYFDGIHPSILFSGENRVGTGIFQRLAVAWDFRNGKLTQRWVYQTPPGQNDEEGHQLRIADVNQDGRDDLIRIGSVVTDSNGAPVTLYSTELGHGDRYHVSDLDPDRPGLEMFAIQQNNPTLLATALQDLGSGVLFKKWYSGSVTDVGRGLTVDLHPHYRGAEVFSTQPGMFDARGVRIGNARPWPWEGIWWDADLNREFFAARDGSGLRPCINRWDYTTETETLLYNVQTEGVHSAYGARPAFFGDLLGDWREEFVVVADDYSALRIYSTTTPATNRFYCLMQNPQYRVQCTFKGYYQASYPDYFLGNDMPPVPIPPVSDAQRVWRGGGANLWDEAATANWLTNNLWISNTVKVPFTSGASVLFDASGSNHAAVTLVGSLHPGDVRVWSPRDYTFAGPGELAGGMALTKAGAGRLILEGTNRYTGRTLVGEGALVVNGLLAASAVTVRGGVWRDGRLCGRGVLGSPVRIEEGGGISPGQGTNSPGLLTLSNHLTLAGRTLNHFDLSDDPTGAFKTNDRLVVAGNLTLIGTNTLVIHKLDGVLPQGSVYPLISYAGALTGSLANLTVAGLTGVPCALTNPPGQIALVIQSYRSPATVIWTGGSGGNAWDLLTTSNWLKGATKDQFAPNDAVRFDSLGASNLTVMLSGALNPTGVVVDSAANYTFAGTGAIIGPASLAKSNTGTLTISTLNNCYTGKTTIAGGTVVVSELNAAGYPSPLGAANSSPANLVLAGSPTLRVTGASYTDRGLTLGAGTNTLDVSNAAGQVTWAGLLTGPGALLKTGPGTLALTRSNNFSGVTIIQAGALSLGGDDANQYGFGAGGTGTVILQGGTLTMFDNSSSYNSIYWTLHVPAGSTGTLNADSRVDYRGALTGAGTLTFRVPYVRTTLYGNWSAFSGQINVTTDSDGGDFRVSNGNGYANASIHLADRVSAYHTTAGASVAIGALSGAAGSKLSNTAWTVGAKNTNSTFAGSIAGNSINKVGTGTWTLTGSNYYTGPTTVTAGTLMVNGDNRSASGAVTVAAGAVLAGTGFIGGATTIQNGGTLSPGSNTIGTLTFTGSLNLEAGCTNRFEINKTASAADRVDVAGALKLGGALVVTNRSGTLAAGDTFRLFNAGTLSGSFQTVALPPLSSTLAWDTNSLAASGILFVTTKPAPSPPRITSVVLGNGALIYAGTGGVAQADFLLLGSSNVALPLGLWERLLTNQFDAHGNFIFTNPPNPAWPQGFYLLQVR